MSATETIVGVTSSQPRRSLKRNREAERIRREAAVKMKLEADRMNLFVELVRNAKTYIREKFEEEDLNEDSEGHFAVTAAFAAASANKDDSDDDSNIGIPEALKWPVLKQEISEAVGKLYYAIYKEPIVVKRPKPRPGAFSIPVLDKGTGLRTQVLTHLKKFYGKEKKRNLVLIYKNDSFDSPFIPFDSFPLDKLVHDYCFTIYYNGNNPITFKIPDDLLEEARKISKEMKIPENVWMPHLKAFYKEKMKQVQWRRRQETNTIT